MLTRRNLEIGAITYLVIGGIVGTGEAQTDRSYAVRIRVDESARASIPTAALARAKVETDRSDAARDLAAHAPPGKAIPIFAIIVGSLVLPVIVQLVKELLREHYYGGVIVDARKSPPEITNDLKLPASTILVVQPNGEVRQYSSNELSADILAGVLGKKGVSSP